MVRQIAKEVERQKAAQPAYTDFVTRLNQQIEAEKKRRTEVEMKMKLKQVTGVSSNDNKEAAHQVVLENEHRAAILRDLYEQLGHQL